MICQAYGFKHSPFQDRVEPEAMLLDARMQQGLARLAYFAEDGQVALLSGGTGLGKSSLMRVFLKTLPRSQYHPLVLESCRFESAALLRMIVTELGERPRLGKDRLFSQILEKTRSLGRILLLVVGEAHLLSEQTLTELRLLSGHERKLLLVGQPDLSRILGRSSLVDLSSRIAVRHTLFPFLPEQTRAYLDHRLTLAGGKPERIEEEAGARIHTITGGNPRLINNLCTLCFLRGSSMDAPPINRDLVEQAAAEMKMMA